MKTLLELEAINEKLLDEIAKLDAENDRYFEGFTAAIGVIHFYMKKYPEEPRARHWLEDYVQSYYGKKEK